MQYVIVGILDSYGDAEAAVQDLELAGIMGEQVEVITDIDEDVRTANTPGEPSTKPREPSHNRIAGLFGAGGPLEKREVRGLSGEQPNYIGEQVSELLWASLHGIAELTRTKRFPPSRQKERVRALVELITFPR